MARRQCAASLGLSRCLPWGRMPAEPTPFEVYESGVLLHGSKADLKVGDLLEPGRESNFAEGRTMNHVYVTARSMLQRGAQS